MIFFTLIFVIFVLLVLTFIHFEFRGAILRIMFYLLFFNYRLVLKSSV